MQTIDCRPCCIETQIVNVPGIEGPPGEAGISPPPPPPPEAPINAYSLTDADFVVPAIGANVAVTFDATTPAKWIDTGMVVVFTGPATFQCVSIAGNGLSGVFKFLGYDLDVAVGSTISAPAVCSPSGTQPSSGSVQKRIYLDDTVPDLRNETVTTSVQIALTNGQAAAYDGNGHLYSYDSASVLADDGISVIKPNAIAPADPGRWRQVI